MKTMKYWVVILITMMLVACNDGGSDGDGNNSGSPGTGSTGSSVEPLVPVNTPVLFFTSIFQTGGSADAVDYTVWQAVPATGEAIPLYNSTSHSFAITSLSVHTFDDRLVIKRNSGSSGFSGGDWRIVDVAAEVDRTGGTLNEPLTITALVATDQGTPSTNCIALSDSTLYWKNADGDLVAKTNLNAPRGSSESILFPAGDAANCQSEVISVDGLTRRVAGMDFAEGVLYSVRYNSSTGLMEFFTRNLSSGEMSPTNPVATFLPTDHANYSPGYAFGFDRGHVYWARVRLSDSQIELWRFEFVGEPQLELAGTALGLNVNNVSELDVDDGVFVIRLVEEDFNTRNLMLFDSNAGTIQLIDLNDIVPPIGGLLPPGYTSVQVMRRAS